MTSLHIHVVRCQQVWTKQRLIIFFDAFYAQSRLIMHDKLKTMAVSFDINIIRPNQKHIGLARQASSFLRCFLSRLINLTSKDTNMEFSIQSFERQQVESIIDIIQAPSFWSRFGMEPSFNQRPDSQPHNK